MSSCFGVSHPQSPKGRHHGDWASDEDVIEWHLLFHITHNHQTETNMPISQPQGLIIIAVRYNAKRTRIAKVKAIYVTGGKHKQVIRTRQEVVANIDDKYIVLSAGIDAQYELHIAGVIAHPIDGERFLKTVANGEKVDNLGELPEF